MTTPQTLDSVLQTSAGIPAEYNDYLRAVLIAPQAVLHRAGRDGETTPLGQYLPASGGSYDIPDREPINILDESSVKLYIEDAELEVFARSIGVSGTVAPVSQFKNRLLSSNLSFKANGTAYPLSSELLGREVKIGDKVVYGATVSSVYEQHSSLVQDILPVKAAAVVGSASAASGNKGTQADSASFSQVSGALNYVTGAASAAAYNDLNGGVNRIYTVVVIGGGDATSARLQVISSDGLDNQASIQPAAFSSPTSIGTKGATLTFSLDNGRPVDAGAPTNLFVVGQRFQVIVAGAYTAPAATASGTYSGTIDDTLIITVTRGGHYADPTPPQITVTTSKSLDSSGPTSILSAGTNVAAGTKGVLVQFNLTGLNLGDVFYVPVTASADTYMRTLVLRDDLPAVLLGVSDGDLSIRVIDERMEVRKERRDASPLYNWQLADPQVVVQPGITGTLTDGTLVDVSNSIRYVPVKDGSMVVSYREWDYAATERLVFVTDVDDAIEKLGSIEADNPAGYQIAQMLTCSNGVPVGLMGVANPTSVTSWGNAIDAVKAADKTYHLCLANGDYEVIKLLNAHLTQQNSSTVENFRVGITSLDLPATLEIVVASKTTDLLTCLATVTDNPDVSGTQYNYVSSVNGQFITNGVKVGDKLRTVYSVDAYGVQSYTEKTISQVINQNTVLVTPSFSVPYAVAQKIEIHRVAKSADLVEYAKTKVATLRSKYLQICVPNTAFDTNEIEQPGYALACNLAACLSGVAPHQPFNYYIIPGFSRVFGAGFYFQPNQMQELEEAGITVFDDDRNGNVYVRRLVTTDLDNIENSYVRNEHGLVFILRNKLSIYRGQANRVGAVLGKMILDAQTAVKNIAAETMVTQLGAMISADATVNIRNHATFRDQVVVEINGNRPYPLNNFTTSFLVPVGQA